MKKQTFQYIGPRGDRSLPHDSCQFVVMDFSQYLCLSEQSMVDLNFGYGLAALSPFMVKLFSDPCVLSLPNSG